MSFTITKVGDWKRVAHITQTMRVRYERAVRVALMREAHFLRGRMVAGIASGAPGGQAFAPLAPTTLAMRKARGFGGSKPLIVTGTLRRSISVVQVRGSVGLGGAVFIGIHRQTKGKNGKSMVNIAEIHEYGRSWKQRLSPRARRYLFAILGKTNIGRGPAGRDKSGRFTKGKYQSKGSKDGMISIHIPARPFIRPVFREYAKPDVVRKRFVQNVAKGVGGIFRPLSA
jgi:hypothetical protein